MLENDPRWKFLIKKYPDRAGMAYEMYLRDPKKGETNPTTYFNYARLRLKANEARYQANLRKYINHLPTME